MKIFISGASSGLGLSLAKRFLHNGDIVWGTGRREFKIEDTGNENFRYSRCDTTQKEEVKNTFEDMVKKDFIPDVAVFCAGSAAEDIIEDKFFTNRFEENFKVNLFGVLYWVEFLLPLFLKRNKGILAAVSSMSIYVENHSKRIGYSASRIALNKTFENLHLEYLNTGIHFKIFNMGRMKETKDIIGTSYLKASASIIKNLKSGKHSNVFNIPYTQFLLTKAVSFIPEKIFRTYLRK